MGGGAVKEVESEGEKVDGLTAGIPKQVVM